MDIADKNRWDESRVILNRLLELEEVKKKPIAILANKIDKIKAEDPALTEEDVKNILGLPNQDLEIIEKFSVTIKVFFCSIAKIIGYGEVFKWIDQ